MSANSKIEWTDNTFNPWVGCSKVSPGCANCYAEGWAKRSGLVKWGGERRRSREANWRQPVKWNREAEISNNAWTAGIRLGNTEQELLDRGFIKPRSPRVFCASLADWLDDEVPVEWLAGLLELIYATPNLDWLLLTKRLENWRERMIRVESYERKKSPILALTATGAMVADWGKGYPPENIWLGTTVENQAMADKRIPELLRIPAKVRFLSCEPLLGEVDLINMEDFNILCNPGIDWVIAGGESGPGARPMHPDWARSLRDQCDAAGVPFFMKQMGGTRKPFAPIPDDLNIRQFPTT